MRCCLSVSLRSSLLSTVCYQQNPFYIQGRQHLKKMMFCTCQSEAEALVSIGFWPGTVEKPATAFDMRLLNMLADLLFECHCSLDKLCATITLWKGPILPSYVSIHILQ